MTLTQILDQLNIEYLPSNKQGEYLIRCINPSHADSNPSMHINETKPYPFYCFSCGCSGSLIKDSKEYFGKSFFEIDSSEKEIGWKKEEKQVKKKEPSEIEYSGDIYPLWRINEALSFAKDRKLSDEFIRFFGCFVVRKWQLSFKDFTGEKKEKYWYNRLVIPICDKDGNIISYEGRDYTRQSKAKVLYPPNSKVNHHLFNYDNIDPNKPVYITEGIMGLSSVWEIDINVISTFGKNLTPEQKALILKLKNIIIIPDNDWDKGTDNVLFMLRQYDDFYPREYKVMLIDKEGADTNDLTQREIKHSMKNKVKLSVDVWMEYYNTKKEYAW